MRLADCIGKSCKFAGVITSRDCNYGPVSNFGDHASDNAEWIGLSRRVGSADCDGKSCNANIYMLHCQRSNYAVSGDGTGSLSKENEMNS